MQKRRISGEAWGLLALFLLFLGFAAYYEHMGQQTAQPDEPSSFNAKPKGVKALYLLLEKYYRVGTLETTWNSLDAGDRLLIIVEPLDKERPITKSEIAALRKWVEQGGAVLYLVTSPARPLDLEDTIFGDVAIVEGKATGEQVPPVNRHSPFTSDVEKIAVNSPVRLKPDASAHYETLFRDRQGALALHKKLGRGDLILVANSAAANNASVRQADNALFLVDVAAATVEASDGRILFDEYHHGKGFASRPTDSEGGLWSSLPVPLRLAIWHLLGLGALLIYNGNRRLGRPRTLPTPAYRPSTDYLGSMARLFRRAGAADIALLTLYRQFVRDLAHALDRPPEARPQELAQRAAQRCGVDDEALSEWMARCEEIAAGRRIC